MTLTEKQRLEVIPKLIEDNFGIALNANDFFYWATADSVRLVYDDFEWAIPLIEKYGSIGQAAVMSKIANQLPIKPYQTETFFKALEEIKDVKPQSEY